MTKALFVGDAGGRLFVWASMLADRPRKKSSPQNKRLPETKEIEALGFAAGIIRLLIPRNRRYLQAKGVELASVFYRGGRRYYLGFH
jgi:hypothetical protein